MARYSQERKQAILAKLLPPYNQPPKEVSDQEGVSLATLYKWRREAREQGTCVPDAGTPGAESWSGRDRFAAVVETASMNEHERAEYCRQRGLYVEQLQRWRVPAPGEGWCPRWPAGRPVSSCRAMGACVHCADHP